MGCLGQCGSVSRTTKSDLPNRALVWTSNWGNVVYEVRNAKSWVWKLIFGEKENLMIFCSFSLVQNDESETKFEGNNYIAKLWWINTSCKQKRRSTASLAADRCAAAGWFPAVCGRAYPSELSWLSCITCLLPTPAIMAWEFGGLGWRSSLLWFALAGTTRESFCKWLSQEMQMRCFAVHLDCTQQDWILYSYCIDYHEEFTLHPKFFFCMGREVLYCCYLEADEYGGGVSNHAAAYFHCLLEGVTWRVGFHPTRHSQICLHWLFQLFPGETASLCDWSLLSPLPGYYWVAKAFSFAWEAGRVGHKCFGGLALFSMKIKKILCLWDQFLRSLVSVSHSWPCNWSSVNITAKLIKQPLFCFSEHFTIPLCGCFVQK